MTDENQIDGTTYAEKDGSGNIVLKNVDQAAIDALTSALDIDGNDVTNSGTTIVDASTNTIGDGTTDADHNSVSTSNATVNGGAGVGIPTTSQSISASIGSWTMESSSRPVSIAISLKAETDGTDNGDMRVQVDKTGNSSADFTFSAIADKNAGSGFVARQSCEFILPEGGQYRILNNTDPTNKNGIDSTQKQTL